jgi:hypothetical protein
MSSDSDDSRRKSRGRSTKASKSSSRSKSKSSKRRSSSSDDDSTSSEGAARRSTRSDTSDDETPRGRRGGSKKKISSSGGGRKKRGDDSDSESSDGEPDVLEDSIRQGLRDKLLSNGGRRMRVLAAACRKTDTNNATYLSKSEFKSIASTLFSKTSSLSRDEVRWLLENLKGRNPRHIMYERLKDVLTDGEVVFDEDGDDGWKGFASEGWAVKSGSVGEWLQNVATPQDRKNFKDFMVMLEAFEKDRGVDARRTMERQGNAIVVRLGPMLNVALKFYVE